VKQLKRNIKPHTAMIIIAFILAVMVVSCKNDMSTISSFSMNENQPKETAKNVEVFYSDSGKIVIQLLTDVLYRYADDEPYLEFPDGLQLNFFDSLMNIKTTLTANYGISWEKTKIMEVKYDVVVNDFEKNEILNTEHLIWDQRQQKIYSDVFVKRTSPDGTLYGDGFDADENLNSYILRNPRGVFTVEENDPDGD
jgi:LPS export ABC transporter protein LptC